MYTVLSLNFLFFLTFNFSISMQSCYHASVEHLFLLGFQMVLFWTWIERLRVFLLCVVRTKGSAIVTRRYVRVRAWEFVSHTLTPQLSVQDQLTPSSAISSCFNFHRVTCWTRKIFLQRSKSALLLTCFVCFVLAVNSIWVIIEPLESHFLIAKPRGRKLNPGYSIFGTWRFRLDKHVCSSVDFIAIKNVFITCQE